MSFDNRSIISERIAELGIKTGIIYETIVTSLDIYGKPHAAAMGIVLIKNENTVHFKIRAYSSSETGLNLSKTKQGVVNITSPEKIVEAALDLCSDFEYTESVSVNVPRLRDAKAWIEFEVISDDKSSNEFIEFLCTPLHVGFFNVKPVPYTRAVSALIEAAIHASRIKLYRKYGMDDKLSEISKLISMYIEIVNRVAPNSKYALIADKIRKSFL